jgi:hypothetical protein
VGEDVAALVLERRSRRRRVVLDAGRGAAAELGVARPVLEEDVSVVEQQRLEVEPGCGQLPGGKYSK